MAVVVHIGGGLRGIRPNTLTFSRSTRETGVASCEVLGREGARTAGEHFRVYGSTGQSEWGGTIDAVDITRLGPGGTEVVYRVSCVTWEQRLNKRFCPRKLYTTENGGERIADLVSSVDEGILVNPVNIAVGASAEELGPRSYFGMTVADALDDICAVGKQIWFCDPGANLFSKPRSASITSSLIFSNASNNFHEPQITEDRTDYLNRVHLAIAFEAFPVQPYEIVGDGITREWTLTEGVTEIQIDHIVSAELNGVVFDIAEIANNPTADWTFEFGTGKIRQDVALPVLTAADTINITLYQIGANVITVEDVPDIEARQLIEQDVAIDASGVYEGWFEDLNVKVLEAGQTRAGALLKERNPHQNGAPSGSLPRKYIFKARGYIPNAHELQPGYVVTFGNTSPDTGGPKQLLIESVSAVHVGSRDPSGDPTGGFLVYTVTCIDYIESYTAGDYLLSLGSRPTPTGTGSVTVTTTGGGAEAVAPAGNMAGLSVESKYVLKSGQWVRQLHCMGLRPDPLGTFKSVALYLEEPDYSSGPPATLDGLNDWNGASTLTDSGFAPVPGPRVSYNANNQLLVIDDLPVFGYSVQGRVYFNSINTAGQENPLIRANQPSPTPSVTYISTPPAPGTVTGGLGEEYAPNLVSVVADGVQPKYQSQSGADPLWGATFIPVYPVDDVRFNRLGGIQIVLQYPEGTRESDSRHGLLTKLSTRDDHPVRAVGFTIRVFFVSVDLDGHPNSIQSNTPYADLFISPPIGPPGEEYSNKVTELQLVADPYYQFNADGQRELIIPGFFRIDNGDPRSASGNIRLTRNLTDTPLGASDVLFESHPEGFFNGVVTNFPITDEPYTYLYVLTMSTNGWLNSFVESGPNATPRIGPFVLPAPPVGDLGQEHIPIGTPNFRAKTNEGFVNGVKYNYQTGGDPTYQIGLLWDEADITETPSLGGWDLYIEYPDRPGVYNHIAGIASNNIPGWISEEWTLVGLGGAFKVYLNYRTVNNRPNRIIPGTTPHVDFTITRTEQPAGPTPGAEWTTPLLGFDVGVQAIAAATQGGQRDLIRVPITVTQPVIAGYSGWYACSISPEGVHVVMSGLIKSNTHIVEFPFVPSVPQTWTLYGLCEDINERRNTYDPGVTLSEPILLLPLDQSNLGQEYTGLVTDSFVGIQGRSSVDGIEQYRYGISWSAPVTGDPAITDPTFGRIKVMEYTQPGFNVFTRSDVSDIGTFNKEDGSTVFTPWAERPFNDQRYRAVALLSVDVNDRCNTFVDGVTPITWNIDVGLLTTGKLNLKRSDATTFDNTDFNFDVDGKLQHNLLSADKMKVGSVLKVGGGPTQKVGQIAAFDASDVMVMWAGGNSGNYGQWSRNQWIGGTSPADAPFKCVNGILSLDNVPLSVSLNDVKTSIKIDTVYESSYAGLVVSSISTPSNKIAVTPSRVNVYWGGVNTASLHQAGLSIREYSSVFVDETSDYKKQYAGATWTGQSNEVLVGVPGGGAGYVRLRFRGGLFVGYD